MLNKCTCLKTVTLSDLPKLEKIESSFLRECPLLREVVWEDLPSLATVGGGCMLACPSLKKIHFSGLPKLTEIGRGFLEGNDLSRLIQAGYEYGGVLGPNCSDAVHSLM